MIQHLAGLHDTKTADRGLRQYSIRRFDVSGYYCSGYHPGFLGHFTDWRLESVNRHALSNHLYKLTTIQAAVGKQWIVEVDKSLVQK